MVKRQAVIAALCVLVVSTGPDTAASVPDPQAAPSAPPSATWELVGAVGPTVSIFHSLPGDESVLLATSWGRPVTGIRGSGPLAGRLWLRVEASTLWLVFPTGTAYGGGVTPVFARWVFAPRGPWTPFTELAGGVVQANRPVPEEGLRLNFSAHVGAGVSYRLAPARSLVMGYRFHHVSNGDRADTNPGVNSHLVFFGLAFTG